MLLLLLVCVCACVVWCGVGGMDASIHFTNAPIQRFRRSVFTSSPPTHHIPTHPPTYTHTT